MLRHFHMNSRRLNLNTNDLSWSKNAMSHCNWNILYVKTYVCTLALLLIKLQWREKSGCIVQLQPTHIQCCIDTLPCQLGEEFHHQFNYPVRWSREITTVYSCIEKSWNGISSLGQFIAFQFLLEIRLWMRLYIKHCYSIILRMYWGNNSDITWTKPHRLP